MSVYMRETAGKAGPGAHRVFRKGQKQEGAPSQAGSLWLCLLIMCHSKGPDAGEDHGVLSTTDSISHVKLNLQQDLLIHKYHS